METTTAAVEIIDPLDLLLNKVPKARKKKVITTWYEGCTTCSQCNKTFATKSALDVHFRTHTGEKPFQCALCLKTFTQRAHIKRHALTHHSEHKGIDAKIEVYDCDRCDKTFKDLRAFKRHSNLHMGFEMRFRCDKCDKSYSRCASLTQHMAVHTAGYSCKMCPANFETFIQLRRHKADEHQKPHLSCNHCDRTFKHQCDLKIHMRKHSEERPFTCEICLKKFKSVSHLNRHLKTHKDYVPKQQCKYQCQQCLVGLNTQMEVIMHACQADPLFSFICAHCDNGYVDKKELARHMKQHLTDLVPTPTQ